MGVEDVDALARARDDECAKTATASPHARRQNAFNRPARQGRTAIIDDHARADDKALRRVVGTVALLNLAYFGVEFAVALRIGSVSLFADSVDFLEDASVNLLILLALGWTVRSRARPGMADRRRVGKECVSTCRSRWTQHH